MKCVSTDTPEQSLGAASLQVSGSLFNFYFYDGDCLIHAVFGEWLEKALFGVGAAARKKW